MESTSSRANPRAPLPKAAERAKAEANASAAQVPELGFRFSGDLVIFGVWGFWDQSLMEMADGGSQFELYMSQCFSSTCVSLC